MQPHKLPKYTLPNVFHQNCLHFSYNHIHDITFSSSYVNTKESYDISRNKVGIFVANRNLHHIIQYCQRTYVRLCITSIVIHNAHYCSILRWSLFPTTLVMEKCQIISILLLGKLGSFVITTKKRRSLSLLSCYYLDIYIKIASYSQQNKPLN